MLLKYRHILFFYILFVYTNNLGDIACFCDYANICLNEKGKNDVEYFFEIFQRLITIYNTIISHSLP